MLFVFCFLIGALFGNLTTSAYHRIPNNKPLRGGGKLGLEPHCASCGSVLKYYEYFPVFSWVNTFNFKTLDFRCRHCACKIPTDYFAIEIISAILAACFYLAFGMNTFFIACFLTSCAFLLNLALLIRHKKIYLKSIFIVLASLTISTALVIIFYA